MSLQTTQKVCTSINDNFEHVSILKYYYADKINNNELNFNSVKFVNNPIKFLDPYQKIRCKKSY